MPYQLTLEHYTGPLHKLLELVETKKLEITLVSLAQVTADFLHYLESLKSGEVRAAESENSRLILSDFLLIASKLLLIKSKVILPSLPLTEEEESDIKNLEQRLKLYQALKNTQKHLREKWNALPKMLSREFLMVGVRVFYPPRKLSKENLNQAISKILEVLKKTLKPQVTIKNEFINLKSKIEEVLRRLKNKPASLENLHGERSRRELIILFLAILHLFKDQLVEIEQKRGFGEILIAKRKKIG